jgi:hypothetical protein
MQVYGGASSSQGVAQVIVYNSKEDMLVGGTDRRAPDGAATGVPVRSTALEASAR